MEAIAQQQTIQATKSHFFFSAELPHQSCSFLVKQQWIGRRIELPSQKRFLFSQYARVGDQLHKVDVEDIDPSFPRSSKPCPYSCYYHPKLPARCSQVQRKYVWREQKLHNKLIQHIISWVKVASEGWGLCRYVRQRVGLFARQYSWKKVCTWMGERC